MLDIKKFIDGLHKYIGEAFAPVVQRLGSLDSRIASVETAQVTLTDVKLIVEEAIDELPPPKDGKDGTSCTAEDVLKLLPVPRDGINGNDGKDGNSVTVEDVQPFIVAEVERAVKAAPVPINGTNGKDGKDGASVTLEQVLAAIEIPQPRDGVNGKDGASVSLEDVRPVIAAEVEQAVKLLPVPRDGKDGNDGKDGKDGASVTLEQVLAAIEIPQPRDGVNGKDGASVSLEDVRPVIAAEVEQAVKLLPVPRDGKDGNSVTVEDVAPLIATEVERAVKALPAPTNGKDGKSVTVEEVLARITVPRDGVDGKDGKDGKNFTAEEVTDLINVIIKQNQASWELDFERRAMVFLQKVADRMPLPKDGKDGRDGLGLEDMTSAYDGRRTFTFRFQRDDVVREFTHKIPMLLECGVFVNGTEYEQGDCVTYGGSYWACLVDKTTKKPGDNNKDWRLVVRKGRDGKDGDKGDRGPPGSAPSKNGAAEAR